MSEAIDNPESLRFTKQRPCPICGGHRDLAQGHGTRCYGWMDSTGAYARCTREERAGEIDQNSDGTFSHRLEGECRCGVTHMPRRPMEMAPAPPTTPLRGTVRHEIRNAEGTLVAVHARRYHEDGKRVWWEGLKGTPADLLYRAEHLNGHVEAPVVLCEGEPAADAVAALGLASLGTVCGAASTLSAGAAALLAGREVWLWPDADDDGAAHMERNAEVLRSAGASVRLLSWAAAPPKGDAADYVAGGGTGEGVRAMVGGLGAAPADESWTPAEILDGVDLNAPPPDPDLLGLGYPDGRFHLVSGRPEAAKTWLMLEVAREVMRRDGAVLILDTDGTGQRDIAQRFINLGSDPEDLEGHVFYSDDPSDWFGRSEIDQVLEWLAPLPRPAMLIVDAINPTLAALGMKLDEMGVTELEARVIAPMKRAGVSVWMTDHLAIHADGDSPYSIGSQRKHGAADVHLRIESGGEPLQRGGQPARFRIRGMKDRPGGMERHGASRYVGRVTFTPGEDGAVATQIDLGPPTPGEKKEMWRPTHLMERVSTWASVQLGTFSKTQVEKDVPGKAQHLRGAVDVLLAEGYLSADGARYKHERAYRQSDDPEAGDGRDGPPTPSLGSSPSFQAQNSGTGPSPRPAHEQAVFGGPSRLGDGAVPNGAEGGPSPPSRTSNGTGDGPTGTDPSDGDLERWTAAIQTEFPQAEEYPF